MARPKRVLSFMSEWGGNNSHRRNASSASAAVSPAPAATPSPGPASPTVKQPGNSSSFSVSSTVYEHQEATPSNRRTSVSSRPMSMIQTYQPPVMEVGQDTLPELQRIFTFLNSHSNKLYQEGYFLKFHDTDTRGRPAPDRQWQECFAQLVGTILSLWDASELDRVGEEAEVLPTFINLTDAAIHMMPSMTLSDGKKLDNILSVSTAASNKYLLHFNSFNSLTQWTAGIRLAMFEHSSLQEAYTGALIAGKGRQLNNMRMLLDRQRTKYEDWVRVRFGAGTPWRRCWCVVSPPDEKELAKMQRNQLKKKDIYNRNPIVLKGDIKFYDTQKIKKKTRPIATVEDAYSCYALYPQSKQLIDQSTLVKVEGKITVHSKPEKVTEGFVFVMPETRPAISGFEIMLQFLFPVWDTFVLYGRPNKLVADVLDSRGLMFAMPPDRRYGYLEMWDIASLIQGEGNQAWSERRWRKELKDLTSKRIATDPRDRNGSRPGTRRNTVGRASITPSRAGTLRFADQGSIRSQPSTRQTSPARNGESEPQAPARVDSAPPAVAHAIPRHQRSVSEQVNGYKPPPSRLSQSYNTAGSIPPTPPPHGKSYGQLNEGYETPDSQPPSPDTRSFPEMQIAPTAPPHGPVETPPTFAHAPGQKPPVPVQNPTTMKPSTNMDHATLDQMADATNTPLPPGVAAAGAAAAWKSQDSLNGRRGGDLEHDTSQNRLSANHRGYSGNPHSGNRLSTIPASPYVEQDQFVESPTAYQSAPPAVPEHAVMPPSQSRASQESVERLPGTGGGQIHRKPLPGRSSMSVRGDDTRSIRSTTSSSLRSLQNDIIDPEALDRFNQANDLTLFRQGSQASSRYSRDDAMSTSTPDYASIVEEEVEPPKPAARRPDRPRSGMLKVVGNPDAAKPEAALGNLSLKDDPEAPPELASEYPSINFGPTYWLDPLAKTPGPGSSADHALTDNRLSQSRENLAATPTEQKRMSYSGRTTPIMSAHMRTSSASPQFSETRSMAWQPGLTSQPQSDKQKLNAEEWVAKRAFSGQSRTPPAFGHGRSDSRTPPPLGRAFSGDWTHLQRAQAEPARPPSRPLSRPLSRGADQLLLDQRPTALSAREQEQVARITNTPLISLSKNPKNDQKPSTAGLTAYIDKREKDKAAAKSSNRNTVAMQAEIDRRMMAAQQRQMMEMQHMSQQMATTPSSYAPSMMGGPQSYSPGYAYSTTPNQMPQMYPQQGYFVQPGMSPGMQQGWTGAQQVPNQYFAQPQQQQQQPQQPATQAYGASFDQAQAAARYAHQQQQQQYRR